MAKARTLVQVKLSSFLPEVSCSSASRASSGLSRCPRSVNTMHAAHVACNSGWGLQKVWPLPRHYDCCVHRGSESRRWRVLSDNLLILLLAVGGPNPRAASSMCSQKGRAEYCGELAILWKEKKQKKLRALTGNRTRTKCLEGAYATIAPSTRPTCPKYLQWTT